MGLDSLFFVLFYLINLELIQTVILLERSRLNIIFLLSSLVLYFPRDTSSDGL